MHPRVIHLPLKTTETNGQLLAHSNRAGADMAPVPISASKAVRHWLQCVDAGRQPNQMMKTARAGHRVSLLRYVLPYGNTFLWHMDSPLA